MPFLVYDVAQPYSAFSNAHMAMGAGCYAKTPRGISTLLGPPVNQKSPLNVHSGLMESEWHHSELFIVFDYPEFEESVQIIEPGTVLAQFYFVAREPDGRAQITFSETDFGAAPAYRERSIKVGLELITQGKEFVISELTGTKSLTVACPHCWVSVTGASDRSLPPDHVLRQDFYQGYKVLRAEYHRARRADRQESIMICEVPKPGGTVVVISSGEATVEVAPTGREFHAVYFSHALHYMTGRPQWLRSAC